MQRLLIRMVLIAVVTILADCALCVLHFAAAAQVNDVPEIRVVPQSNMFLVYGDIRFTDPSRCTLSDPKVRVALINRMAHSEEKPDFLVITGDIVYHGDSEKDWHVFDDETKPLRENKFRLFPVLGNHDIHGPSGQSRFIDHFDELKSYSQLKENAWYSIDYGNSHFIMLDSQSSYEPETPQGEWIRRELKRVPEDLDFLFIVLHHPIVTQPASRFPFVVTCAGQPPLVNVAHDVEDAEKHLKKLLDEFAENHRRTVVVVFSGHNHNYEHYLINGITYIVTAGGGASPYKISRQKGFYREAGPTYHFCKVKIEGHTLKFEMYKLDPKRQEWERKDPFELSSGKLQALTGAKSH